MNKLFNVNDVKPKNYGVFLHQQPLISFVVHHTRASTDKIVVTLQDKS